MSEPTETPRPLSQLQALAESVLGASGVSAGNARSVALALIAAERDGIASHGLSRLPFYADQARSGKVDGHANPSVETAGSVVRVDAGCGFAYPAIAQGLSVAVPLARSQGVAALAIARSHHFGVAGHPVEAIAEAGLVGIALGNTPAAMAPWGGRTPVFGTNPLAFAAPRHPHPLVVDLSLSKVARGRIMVAAKRGDVIPEGWALDAQGAPTTDPDAALAGSMVPLGDAKGAALALMVEILTAGLTGSHLAFEASSFFTAEGDPPCVAQLFLLLDPDRFAGAGVFAERLETLAAAILGQPGTRLPGERRLLHRQQADRVGVVVPAALLRDLEQRSGSV